MFSSYRYRILFSCSFLNLFFFVPFCPKRCLYQLISRNVPFPWELYTVTDVSLQTLKPGLGCLLLWGLQFLVPRGPRNLRVLWNHPAFPGNVVTLSIQGQKCLQKYGWWQRLDLSGSCLVLVGMYLSVLILPTDIQGCHVWAQPFSQLSKLLFVVPLCVPWLTWLPISRLSLPPLYSPEFCSPLKALTQSPVP